MAIMLHAWLAGNWSMYPWNTELSVGWDRNLLPKPIDNHPLGMLWNIRKHKCNCSRRFEILVVAIETINTV